MSNGVHLMGCNGVHSDALTPVLKAFEANLRLAARGAAQGAVEA